MSYTKCAANAAISPKGYRVGFKGRSGVYFEHLDSTCVISSEYARDTDDQNPIAVLYIDSPWLVDGEELNSVDIPKEKRYFILSEVIGGLVALGYRVKLLD